MKNYFSHDYYATLDPKIIALLGDYGAVGYGIYWRIVEMLHAEESHTLPLKDYIYKALAQQMVTSVEQISTIINDCINVYELFIEEDNNFYSKRVLENIEKMEETKEKRSKAGKISAERRKNATNAEQSLTCVQQNLTCVQQNLTQSNKIKENKIKENKIKEIKDNNNKEEINKEDEVPIDEKQFNYLEYHTYYDLVEHAKKEESWFNSLLRLLKLEKETILSELENFPIVQEAKGNKVTNLKDFKNHFFNYMNLRKDDLRKVERKKSEISIVDRLEIERQKYFEILKKEQNGISKSTAV